MLLLYNTTIFAIKKLIKIKRFGIDEIEILIANKIKKGSATKV